MVFRMLPVAPRALQARTVVLPAMFFASESFLPRSAALLQAENTRRMPLAVLPEAVYIPNQGFPELREPLVSVYKVA